MGLGTENKWLLQFYQFPSQLSYTYSFKPSVTESPACLSSTCASAFVSCLVLCPLIEEIKSPSLTPLNAALLPGLTCNQQYKRLFSWLSNALRVLYFGYYMRRYGNITEVQWYFQRSFAYKQIISDQYSANNCLLNFLINV